MTSTSRTPAPDMADLALRLRATLRITDGQEARLPLGGHLPDVVLTSAGDAGQAVLRTMEEEQSGGCGPVIHAPGVPGHLCWLVPPGTAASWEPHRYAVCLGAPAILTVPPPARTAPGDIGALYWLRPCDGVVDPRLLREALDQHAPQPVPAAEDLP